MSQRFSDRLQAFLEHCAQKGIWPNGVEVMLLEVYDNWLRAQMSGVSEKKINTKEEAEKIHRG